MVSLSVQGYIYAPMYESRDFRIYHITQAPDGVMKKMGNPDLFASEDSGAEEQILQAGAESEPIVDDVGGDSASASSSEATLSDMELFTQYLEQDTDFGHPERGDLREGTIVEMRPSELLINVGLKRDGIIPQSDLQKLDKGVVEAFEVGQTVTVMVTQADDRAFIFSISEALQQQDWIDAQELLDTGGVTTQKVIGFNKGGLTVEYNNLRGFVPASHLMDMPRNLSEEARRNELESRVDTEMRLKVIEVERRRRRLVMSQMLAEREYRQERKDELFNTLKVGDVVEGVVRGLRPFGAFVDIGGADGLLHVSELDWSPVTHPQNVLKRGDKVEVQVIRLDSEKQQIALSRKRLLPNPWDGVEERFALNSIVPAKITRVVDFGAFAELEPGVEGLVHISEIADISVAEPLKTVKSGDEVDVKILRVDPKRQRVGLSIRQAIGVLVPDDSASSSAEAAPESDIVADSAEPESMPVDEDLADEA